MNLYFLEIYLSQFYEGFVDTFSIIASYDAVGVDNFKLSIVIRVVELTERYLPERQFQLIGYNFGVFSYSIFRMVKPFLPGFILSKIKVFGTN